MEAEAVTQLDQERRAKLIDLKDEEINSFYVKLLDILGPKIKEGISLEQVADEVLIQSLLLANRDRLSGITNKTGLRIEVEAAMAVAQKLKIPVTVLYMDGKGFKEVNDRLGHAQGDEVIAAIGDGLKTAAKRKTDIIVVPEEETLNQEVEPNIEVGREGGDEFAAILLGTNINGGTIVAQRMQTAVAGAVNNRVPRLQQLLGHPFEVTVGSAEYVPSIHKSAEDLIKAADDNLTAIRQQMGIERRG